MPPATECFVLGTFPLCPSRIGFGGHPVGGHGWGQQRDDAGSMAALRAALDCGYTFFDTADVYGLGVSETLHGRLLREVGSSGGDILVATKGGVDWDSQGRTRRDSSPAHLRRALEASLRRLQLEAIDLYYLHWPDGRTPVAASVAELVRLREEGKLRAIGLANVSAAEIRSNSWAGISAVQVKGNLLELDAVAEVAEAARGIGAAVVCYAGLADGLLAGRMKPGMEFLPSDHRSRYPLFQPEVFPEALGRVERVVEVAGQLGRSPSQVALRWLLDSGVADSVLCGSTRVSHVRDNAAAMGWALPQEVVKDLGRTVPILR